MKTTSVRTRSTRRGATSTEYVFMLAVIIVVIIAVSRSRVKHQNTSDVASSRPVVSVVPQEYRQALQEANASLDRLAEIIRQEYSAEVYRPDALKKYIMEVEKELSILKACLERM